MSVSPIVIKVGGALLDDAAAMTRLFLSVKDCLLYTSDAADE